ncbi:acyl-CoA dehydrogenase family protein [Streptomyces turgidiscabies]|uniref:D-Ala-D-Ala dipeptidase n=1 Tax=Streptomyces turgidiscabies (strain Car8) TaxID=698760 RepID=L7F1F9_STRT8|nr:MULTISPECIES: acyl-CoA dehydrogenase family protein [Streptomyces]ELP64435.1 D-Ala-D-Ala dipeptidase [Streptomyces turgidiscabies Car8]MDX3491292.1 acyl-CoA/acyl-ACP dehydrogenase [Streptomyces turgidiscabies]GAQ77070.1 acyl-CoA dehydrogenase [Streptomyces turgidiscabies]
MSYRTALAEVLARAVAPCAQITGMEGRFPRGAVTAFGATGLLGLTVSTEFGGAGLGLAEAAEVVARTAQVCPATAAVLRSHYTAVAVIESYGSPWVRGEIAAGRHLGSLALAEDDTGEQVTEVDLLMPRCTAVRSGGVVALRARKRRVVAAGEADSYVWSSRPLGVPEGLSLWGVPAHAPDLFVPARPDGAGPPGSGTSTVFADPVLVPADARLGADGGGHDIVLRTVLPWLLELRAAAGVREHPFTAAAARPTKTLAAS